ncbi:nitrogen permease regulator 2 [Limtongia smithiae]|uniref:nitrogen permease regulator 2 n=1 Tax=Limtongia smithiae TaxID=1125753 RepID=UPI0034CF55DC
MTDFGGFPQILSLFYTVFHPTQGIKVIHQVPPGSVIRTSPQDDPSALAAPLFDFDEIHGYIIPPPPFCNKLITLRTGNGVGGAGGGGRSECKIVSHPVMISSAAYERNYFIFNFCFVFHKDADVSAYIPVVRKLGRMFQALEEQNRFLSSSLRTIPHHPGAGPLPGDAADAEREETLRSIIDQVFEDLNNYCECYIPIDEYNNINIKLFPLHPPPPNIKSFHVPISTVRLKSLMDVNWDPTMEKIVDYINGINSVRKIADLADTDYDLTRKCIQHLMYYDCVIIVDIFQFSNAYACTPAISALADDPQMAAECVAYVASAVPPSRNGKIAPKPLQACELLELYCSLHNGQPIMQWMFAHKDKVRYIDVRRFISFGIIKGIIYRVNTYSVLEHHPDSSLQPPPPPPQTLEDRRLIKLSRRMKNFDDICTDLQLSKEQAIRTLEKYGDVVLIFA